MTLATRSSQPPPAVLALRTVRRASYGPRMNTSAHRVLLVDDDSELCGMLGEYLSRAGLEVTSASDGNMALEVAVQSVPDLLILDVSMPGMDGFEVMRRLHQHSHVPVIFLTGRDEDADRVRGLDLGADDYLTKPFNSRELLARVHAILRRTGATRPDRVIEVGPLRMDGGTRRVTVLEQSIELTNAEYRILEILADRVGQVVSRTDLMRLALGRPYLGLDRSIDTHVSSLRRKLGPDFERSTPLQSARGLGYIMRGPGKPAAE
jgi:two-component system, OmpR family, response regulator CpxR